MVRIVLLFLFILAMSACESAPVSGPATPDPRTLAPLRRIYFATFDKVWRAAHSAIPYSIALENQDSGIIETDYIRGVDGWLPPEADRPKAAGLRYKLIFSFAKGRFEGRDSTHVTIEKRSEILRNFFSEPERSISDGLEERTIFYRIEREIIISDALKKAN